MASHPKVFGVSPFIERTLHSSDGTVPVKPISDSRSAVRAVSCPKQSGIFPRILVNWESSKTTKFVRLHNEYGIVPLIAFRLSIRRVNNFDGEKSGMVPDIRFCPRFSNCKVGICSKLIGIDPSIELL